MHASAPRRAAAPEGIRLCTGCTFRTALCGSCTASRPGHGRGMLMPSPCRPALKYRPLAPPPPHTHTHRCCCPVGDTVRVADNSSTNGTSVDGADVKGTDYVELPIGGTIVFGEARPIAFSRHFGVRARHRACCACARRLRPHGRAWDEGGDGRTVCAALRPIGRPIYMWRAGGQAPATARHTAGNRTVCSFCRRWNPWGPARARACMHDPLRACMQPPEAAPLWRMAWRVPTPASSPGIGTHTASSVPPICQSAPARLTWLHLPSGRSVAIAGDECLAKFRLDKLPDASAAAAAPPPPPSP